MSGSPPHVTRLPKKTINSIGSTPYFADIKCVFILEIASTS